jgi:hypothetical protein
MPAIVIVLSVNSLEVINSIKLPAVLLVNFRVVEQVVKDC